MKIKNKFDMLDAMSDINEEYVRKADRLLAQHRSGEAALKMEITPMKFSWKPIAAAAACLVVLIGVTFGIKALMKKPVDVLTPVQQAYLDEWKDKIGTNVNVAYAVDRLTFIEIELPEDVNTNRFIDENRAVFLRDKKINDEPHKTLEIYNIREKTCSVIAELDPERTWDIYNADKDYVLYQSYKGDYGTEEELYLYDVNAAQNHLIYKEETNDTDLSYSSSYINNDKIAFCGRVYFPAYDRITGMPSLHIYDIESGTEFGVFRNIGDLSNYSSNIFYACGENGQYYSGTVSGTESDVSKGVGSPSIYKGDVLYGTEENGKFVTRSLSGKYSFDGGVWATEYGLYQFEAVGGRLTKLDTGMEIIPANSSGGIINLDNRCDFALQFGGMSLNSAEASQSALRFLFYAPTDEILVFRDGDGFGELNCFGWGATISKKEPDGTVRTFIVTDKESEYAVKIPKYDEQSEDKYLEEMKYIFGAQGSVDYARNKLDIKEYDIPGFESRPLLIDKDHAVVSKKDNDGRPKIVIYDLASGIETLLYGFKDDHWIESDTEIEVKYVNKDYVVFEIKFYRDETVTKHELRMINIKSGRSYTAHTIYVNNGVHHIMVIVDGSLYFYDSNIIYRYKIGSEEQAVPVRQHGYNLKTYNGNVYYNEYEGFSPTPLEDAVRIYTRILDGEMPVDTEKYGGWLMIGETGIFHNNHQTITNCLNDKELLSFNTSGYLSANLYDSMLMVIVEDNKTYQGRKVIYNTKTNELLVFAKGDDLYYDFWDYREFDGGMYYALENDGAYNKLCVITDKEQSETEERDERSKHLAELKAKFGAEIPMGYVEDNFNTQSYELPEFINGKTAEYFEKTVIDKTRLIVGSKNDGNSVVREFGIYDFVSGSYEPLYIPSEDVSFTAPGFVNADYFVFTVTEGSEKTNALYVIDLKSLDRSPILACKETEGAYLAGVLNSVILDKKLYFDVNREIFWDSSRSLYCYDIETRQLERVVETGCKAAVYNNGIAYYSSGDISFLNRVAFLDGSPEIASSNTSDDFYICENNIFKIEPPRGDRASLKDVTTKQIILSTENMLYVEAQSGNYLEFYDYAGPNKTDTYMVYDIVNEKLLVYENGFGCDAWLSDGTGAAFSYGLSLTEDTYRINEISVFTAK